MNRSLGLFSENCIFFFEEYFLQLFPSFTYIFEYVSTCTQTHIHNFILIRKASLPLDDNWYWQCLPEYLLIDGRDPPIFMEKNIFFISFTYFKARLSCIFAKCPGQSTLVLSVNTRRFCITYFMLRCKTVSPRGLRSLRKNNIFLMSMYLSFIKSLFQARRDVNFWTLPP